MAIKGLDAQTAVAGTTAQKPPHFRLENVIRPNILNLEPYRCARDDYQSGILLDANENSMGHSLPAGASVPHNPAQADGDSHGPSSSVDQLKLNRYPDPDLFGVKNSIAKLRDVPGDPFVFLGVGSDEVLDLIQRVSCRPGKDKILICPPTYGMYSVCAAVNDIEVVKVPLLTEGAKFTLDVERINQTLAEDQDIKLVFICSPGNPTGTLIPLSEITPILDNPAYRGLVVVDEAYIDFAEQEKAMGKRPAEQAVSAVSLVREYQNLLVTQTLSKAFGLAAIRLGLAFGQPPLIQIMNTTKAPYNISSPTAHLASLALTPAGIATMQTNVQTLIRNRDTLIADLKTVPGVGEIIGGNEANFVLARMLDFETRSKPDASVAALVYTRMAEERGLVVRNRAKELGCDGCLRITVGTEEENKRCVQLLSQLLANKGQWAD